MKLALLLLSIITVVFSCSINVCLRLTSDINMLTLICKTDDLHLPVLFRDNFGQEIVICNVPKPYPECHPHQKNITAAQNPDKNETKVTVNGTIDDRINGNWSCHHGKYGAFVEINIPKTKAHRKDNDVSSDKIMAPTVICLLCLLIIFFIVIMIMKYREQCVCPCCCHNRTNEGIQLTSDSGNMETVV